MLVAITCNFGGNGCLCDEKYYVVEDKVRMVLGLREWQIEYDGDRRRFRVACYDRGYDQECRATMYAFDLIDDLFTLLRFELIDTEWFDDSDNNIHDVLEWDVKLTLAYFRPGSPKKIYPIELRFPRYGQGTKKCHEEKMEELRCRFDFLRSMVGKLSVPV